MKKISIISTFVICSLFSVSGYSFAALLGAAASAVGSLASAFSGVKCGDKTGVQKIDYMIANEIHRQLSRSYKLTVNESKCLTFFQRLNLGAENDFGFVRSDYLPGDYKYRTDAEKAKADKNALEHLRGALRNFGKTIPGMRNKVCPSVEARLAGLAAEKSIQLPQAMQDTVQQFCR